MAEQQTEPVARRGSGTLEGKVAIITGGDSGIGRTVAREGADNAIVNRNEHDDASYMSGQVLHSNGGEIVES